MSMKKELDTHLEFEKEERAKGNKQVLLPESRIKQLRQYQRIINTSVHPDTKEVIAWPMRMSAFIPTNLPIIFGILMTAPTPFNTALWQWINQTYNAGMNYGNRNASSDQTVGDILAGYAAAASSSVTVALTLRYLSQNFTKNLKGGSVVLANSGISYFAMATAGFLNTYCMRRAERQKGVMLVTKDGEEAGLSPIAAREAVLQTAFSRCILAFPIMAIPGISMFALDKFKLIPKSFAPKTILELTVISFALWVALPSSVALFPQYGEIEANRLEPKFQEYKTQSNGQHVDKFFYNKGL